MAVFSPTEVAEQAAGLLCVLALAIQPAPEQKISEWAAGRIDIPGETGTDRPGKLSWEGYEYLIEPLDRLHQDDPTRDVTFVGSAQVAKTTIGIIATLYYSAVVPRPWGVALPSTDEVSKYNSIKWQPIVDETPELRRKIKPVASRDERGSTASRKRFAGGTGLFFGAGSPKALQMVSFCLAVYEETPNWEKEVGGRGDPRSQIRARQLRWEMAGAKTFHNSTPGLKRPRAEGEEGSAGCPVTEDFLAGDQRRLYHPCPMCADRPDGVWLRLDWRQMAGLAEGERPHFVCPSCGGVIEHRHKADMVRRSVWLPTFPSADEANPAPDWFVPASELDRWRARPVEHRAPSYHAWQVVSSAVDWSYIAAEFRKVETKGEGEKITFSQQILGEAYELTVQKAEISRLLEKRTSTISRAVVPAGFELLTCAVDLNGDWAQATVYGWGPGGAHVVVDKERIDGSPGDAELWQAISALRARSYPHEDGGRLGIEAFGVDTGYGTVHVYAWCNRFPNVRALDGSGGKWGMMPLRRAPIQKLKGPDGTVVRCRTWRVGTWDLKRELLNEALPLGLEQEADARLPGKPIWAAWLEKDFFEELTAETLIEKQDKKTGAIKPDAWVKIRRRNEEMDLWVYNAALARSLGVGIAGAEPDWLELARKRTAGQLELAALWDRPAMPGSSQPANPKDQPADPWDWRKRS